MNTTKRGQIRAIDPTRGLHISKDLIQATHMKVQCSQLVECWSAIMHATEDQSPTREREFKLKRERSGSVIKPEDRWERALWSIWGPDITHPSNEFLPGYCKSIQTYQMPLAQHGQPVLNRKWGEIDLVGVGTQRHPVLIELKEPRSGDTPLSAIMEIAAYGIAFLKSWRRGGLKDEWIEAVGSHSDMPLNSIKLLVAAARPYWERWATTLARCKDEMSRLSDAMSESGLKIHLVTLECSAVVYTP